jgi:tetratricopeptide (TPR) repeat protein
MRNQSFIVASIAALLMFGASRSAPAQQQSQPVPDAPQPQKKPADKSTATDPKQASPAKDDNAFPEDVSKAAAKQASDSDPAKSGDSKPATKDDNPFPEAVSKAAAKQADPAHADPAQAGDSKPATKDDNPFPEDVSRDAAKAAGNDSAPDAKRDIPPGVSSSSSQSSGAEADEPGAPPTVVDPARAKKDADVAGFYLKTGNYQGALLRYKDATASDPANVEAIFGLAEAQRMLKKNSEAARNYQLYLDIVPNGPKAKQALKALKTLPPTG